MNGTLPTPILQEVLNNGPIFIAWRSLGSNTLWAIVKLFDASGLIQTESSEPGASFYQLSPNKPLNNPPYSVVLAATDGTNPGLDSVAIPVIIYQPLIKELTYDTVTVAVTLKSPSPPQPANTYYILTTYKDGDGQNSPPFVGLKGEGTLDHAPATSNCFSIVSANIDTPQGQFSCTSTGPPSAQVGIITQLATIQKVQYFSSARVDVIATGPSSVGPPVTGHRYSYGTAICNAQEPAGDSVLNKDFDGDSAVLDLTDVDTDPATCVIAAGMDTSASAETISIGPFSAPLQMITQAPSFLSLMSTTDSALLANWSAVPPPPNGQIVYTVELYRADVLIAQQSTSLLKFTFSDQIEPGRIYTTAVLATSDDGKVIGPTSEQAPGPFISNSPTVAYDSLGRLVSLPITGYRQLIYDLDDFGNIMNAKVSDDNA